MLLENNVGVPQGSILGPLLFLIFFNDLPQIISGDIECYADDSTMMVTGSSVQDIGPLMSTDCEKVINWTSSNKFKLNTEKTKIMLMGTSPKLKANNHHLKVDMGGVQLTQSDKKSELLLGIQIQEDLKWSEQITFLASRLQSR